MVRKLHCPRNTIHLNLFASFILRASVSFMKENLLVSGLGFPSDVIQTPDSVFFMKQNSPVRSNYDYSYTSYKQLYFENDGCLLVFVGLSLALHLVFYCFFFLFSVHIPLICFCSCFCLCQDKIFSCFISIIPMMFLLLYYAILFVPFLFFNLPSLALDLSWILDCAFPYFTSTEVHYLVFIF